MLSIPITTEIARSPWVVIRGSNPSGEGEGAVRVSRDMAAAHRERIVEKGSTALAQTQSGTAPASRTAASTVISDRTKTSPPRRSHAREWSTSGDALLSRELYLGVPEEPQEAGRQLLALSDDFSSE